jgi:hypothetical protein
MVWILSSSRRHICVYCFLGFCTMLLHHIPQDDSSINKYVYRALFRIISSFNVILQKPTPQFHKEIPLPFMELNIFSTKAYHWTLWLVTCLRLDPILSQANPIVVIFWLLSYDPFSIIFSLTPSSETRSLLFAGFHYFFLHIFVTS